MAGFSDYLENAVINYWLRANAGTFSAPGSVYLALFTADPTDTGDTTNEVTQGTNSYVRQAVTFDAESGGSTSNSAEISFVDMPAATITHFGLFDASTYKGGNMLYSDALTASVTTTAGDTLTLAVGNLGIAHD